MKKIVLQCGKCGSKLLVNEYNEGKLVGSECICCGHIINQPTIDKFNEVKGEM